MRSCGEVKRMKKDPNNIKGRGAPPNMAVSWGRGASEYRPGLFVKQYFIEHEEACAADVFHALNEELERINKERVEIGELPIRGGTYNSFAKYWHWFKLLGLIEPVDRLEPAIYDFLQKRQFYHLSDRGKAEEQAWQDPVRTAHPEFH